MQLGAPIEHHAQQSPQALALHFDGEDVTYAEFWRRVLQAQAALQQRGIAAGDRVAWLGQNSPAMLVLLFALARLDAILVPLNYRLAEPELTAILQDAGARLLVLNAAGLANAPGPQPGLSCMPATALAAPVQIATRSGAGLDDAPVLLVYTSGTTGKAKGALYRQSALLANCRIAAVAQEMHRTDRVLTVLPLFHVGGLCIQTLPALHLGAQVHLQRSFDAGAWLCAVQSRRPTLSLMVPATLRAVLDHASFAATDLSSLRLLMTGSSVVPLALIEPLHARGIPVGQVYGATETGPVSIYLGRAQAMAHPGSAGQAAPGVEVRLLGTGAQPVAVGEVGEICIRGPNTMLGYWEDPDNPAFRDGWFHSGDLAQQDADGYYWVVGRAKDMLISGGENIYPAEIENLLSGHPDVIEVAVLGVADATWGEVVVAAVVRRQGSGLDEASVRRLLAGRVASFKIPQRVAFFDSLPKTALGKVQKALLRLQMDAQGPGGQQESAFARAQREPKGGGRAM